MIKSKKYSLVTTIEEDFIYLIKCKNRHSQEFTIGIGATLEKAEAYKTEWSEKRQNDSYWMKNEDGSLAVFFEKKPVKNVDIYKVKSNSPSKNV